MNDHVRTAAPAQKNASSRFKVIDCDIHPVVNSYEDVYPWLDEQWRDVLKTYGALPRHGFQYGSCYPKGQPEACRRDAWPDDGIGKAGGVLELMQRQHLDMNNVDVGILNPLAGGQTFRNPGMSAAYCHAINQWQANKWLANEPRLRGSIVIPYNHVEAAVREIEEMAANPAFVQVLFLSRTADPLGNSRYWPIYEAAEAAGLPIGVHAFGYSGYPVSSSGWPSFYFEEMFGHSPSCQAVVTSMVVEGVFERFPKLKVAIIEAGIAWLPSLAWRLDRHWRKLKNETPHLKRAPSEYIRDHIWITTQPIEEPEPREHLLETLEWIGWDRICFASDYPHWDFDDPMFALPLSKLSREQTDAYFQGNARSLYETRLT